eukprot:jgi/Psemu1/287063/fgenesh1_pg.173_\
MERYLSDYIFVEKPLFYHPYYPDIGEVLQAHREEIAQYEQVLKKLTEQEHDKQEQQDGQTKKRDNKNEQEEGIELVEAKKRRCLRVVHTEPSSHDLIQDNLLYRKQWHMDDDNDDANSVYAEFGNNCYRVEVISLCGYTY